MIAEGIAALGLLGDAFARGLVYDALRSADTSGRNEPDDMRWGVRLIREAEPCSFELRQRPIQLKHFGLALMGWRVGGARTLDRPVGEVQGIYVTWPPLANVAE